MRGEGQGSRGHTWWERNGTVWGKNTPPKRYAMPCLTVDRPRFESSSLDTSRYMPPEKNSGPDEEDGLEVPETRNTDWFSRGYPIASTQESKFLRTRSLLEPVRPAGRIYPRSSRERNRQVLSFRTPHRSSLEQDTKPASESHLSNTGSTRRLRAGSAPAGVCPNREGQLIDRRFNHVISR